MRGITADYRAEIRQRLARGERITGPRPGPNNRPRPFTWPNGSCADARTLRPMLEAGDVRLVPLGDGRHEVVLAGESAR